MAIIFVIGTLTLIGFIIVFYSMEYIDMEDQEIMGRLNDLNTRLTGLFEWVNTTLRDKITEYDKENDLQNDRLNKLEYELLNLKKTV